ncbi:MAG: hypothetical protein OEU92_11655 [Alphaproteobacteria bacterium]|nr:hypothetical protein [Alphaproteobacteria bacterium]
MLPANTGGAFLQSRTSDAGEVGTEGAGLIPYTYRVNLKRVRGITAASCVARMSFDAGPIAQLNYDGSGPAEDMFVVTRGGIGSVRPSSAERVGDKITIHFRDPVCPGESSYFFGFASDQNPIAAVAELRDTLLGDVVEVALRVPEGGSPPPVVSSNCDILGGSALGIPRWLPVCRCLEDPGLREFRCALAHPDFFLVRRIPWPIPVEQEFDISWTMTPLTNMRGDITIKEDLPSSFSLLAGDGRLVFTPELTVGQPKTSTLRARAGSLPGRFRARAEITSDDKLYATELSRGMSTALGVEKSP